jgi:hypothetical protein
MLLLHFSLSRPHVRTEHCRKALEEDWEDADVVGPTLQPLKDWRIRSYRTLSRTKRQLPKNVV